jgi:hypothetical protein
MIVNSAADAESDIVWGAVEIGKVINRSPRAAFHLLENGRLPARKTGRLWSASRRRLLEYLAGELGNE